MSWIVSLVLDWIYAKLASLISAFIYVKAQQEQIQEDAEKSVEKLGKAESASEIDAGADDALDGL